MMNIDVVMIGDGFREVHRVCTSVMDRGNSQTRYGKVWLGEDMYVLYVHDWPNSRDVMHGIGEGQE